jgi:hypothetical protein
LLKAPLLIIPHSQIKPYQSFHFISCSKLAIIDLSRNIPRNVDKFVNFCGDLWTGATNKPKKLGTWNFESELSIHMKCTVVDRDYAHILFFSAGNWAFMTCLPRIQYTLFFVFCYSFFFPFTVSGSRFFRNICLPFI